MEKAAISTAGRIQKIKLPQSKLSPPVRHRPSQQPGGDNKKGGCFVYIHVFIATCTSFPNRLSYAQDRTNAKPGLVAHIYVFSHIDIYLQTRLGESHRASKNRTPADARCGEKEEGMCAQGAERSSPRGRATNARTHTYATHKTNFDHIYIKTKRRNKQEKPVSRGWPGFAHRRRVKPCFLSEKFAKIIVTVCLSFFVRSVPGLRAGISIRLGGPDPKNQNLLALRTPTLQRERHNSYGMYATHTHAYFAGSEICGTSDTRWRGRYPQNALGAIRPLASRTHRWAAHGDSKGRSDGPYARPAFYLPREGGSLEGTWLSANQTAAEATT